MAYLEVTLRVPEAAGEAAAHLLRAETGAGVALEDGAGTVAVRGYLSGEPGAGDGADQVLEDRLASVQEGLNRLPGHFPGVPGPWELSTRMVAEEDWAHGWKAYFKPLRVGRRLVVVPSWESFEAEPGDVLLSLDPGMAFGTGTHPSTALALQALEVRVRPGQTVLDVGTGSGILAIAARKLGAARVVAIDIDPVAVRVAGENATHNGVEVEVQEGEVNRLPGAFADVVVANIVADVLVEIGPELARVLRPGGLAIGSGIIARELPRVEAAWAACGLRHEEGRWSEGWAVLIARRGREG